ncbi:MAG TPA: hypothetical protein VM734_03295 [Kofleriaceae bacterium]|jgi:hypothetical protein|nr:hypothetical protein [Kofleriaceae bacterium]
MSSPARLHLAIVLAAAGGCGERAAAPAATAAAPVVATLVAPPAGPDDVIVARVDGRPVWGSCVAAQAAGRPERRAAALDECVALEVAAQEAERRGLDRDPDVIDEATRALVARFVDQELRAKVRTVADLPPAMVDQVFAKQSWRMHRPEYRSSFFARIELDDTQRGTPADQAAEQAARAAYAGLAMRQDLFPHDVEAALRAAAGTMTVVTAVPDPAVRDGILQPYYRDALFALPAIGTVAPPVRGPYGWDLILYTDQLTELESTKDEVLAQLFPALRQRYFERWTTELGKRHRVERLVDDATLRAALGDDAPAPGGDPR